MKALYIRAVSKQIFFPNKEVLMKKKVVSVLMAAAMVAGMAGCGSSNTGNAEQQIQMLLQIMKQPQRQ